MGMRDDAADIVERDTADLLPVFRNREEAAMDSHMQAVGGQINHALHEGKIPPMRA